MAVTTWDPSFKSANITLSGGNLVAALADYSAERLVRATNGYATGKRYFEILVNDVIFNYSYDIPNYVYLVSSSATIGDYTFNPYVRLRMGCGSGDYGSVVQDSSSYEVDWYAGTFTDGIVVRVAVDLDAHKVWFGRNDVWGRNETGDPSAGTDPDYSLLGADTWYPAFLIGWATGSYCTGRFATADFSYTPPSGFLGWDEEGGSSLPAGFYAQSHKMLTTGIDWNSATLRLAWVSSGYAFSDAHTTLTDLGANIVATSGTITQTATDSVLGVGDVDFTMPNTTGAHAVLYAAGSYEGVTDPLLFYLAAVSTTTHGTNLRVSAPNLLSIS